MPSPVTFALTAAQAALIHQVAHRKKLTRAHQRSLRPLERRYLIQGGPHRWTLTAAGLVVAELVDMLRLHTDPRARGEA